MRRPASKRKVEWKGCERTYAASDEAGRMAKVKEGEAGHERSLERKAAAGAPSPLRRMHAEARSTLAPAASRPDQEERRIRRPTSGGAGRAGSGGLDHAR